MWQSCAVTRLFPIRSISSLILFISSIIFVQANLETCRFVLSFTTFWLQNHSYMLVVLLFNPSPKSTCQQYLFKINVKIIIFKYSNLMHVLLHTLLKLFDVVTKLFKCRRIRTNYTRLHIKHNRLVAPTFPRCEPCTFTVNVVLLEGERNHSKKVSKGVVNITRSTRGARYLYRFNTR